MGHIELAAPVSHIWYFKGSPSRLGYLLDIAPKELEKVLYFASSIITSVDKEAREEDVEELRDELSADLEELDAERDRLIAATRRLSVDYVPEEDEFVDDIDEEERLTPEEVEEEVADLYEEFNERKALRNEAFDAFLKIEPKQLVPDEQLYREMRTTTPSTSVVAWVLKRYATCSTRSILRQPLKSCAKWALRAKARSAPRLSNV